MVQETAKPLVKVIKVRRLVPELRDLVSRVARCHYTEEYQREVSQTETLRISWVSTFPHLRDSTMML
jgi:predicted nucleic-acid-binding Zn-ribbon protein